MSISKLFGMLALLSTAGLQADNLRQEYPGSYSDIVSAARQEKKLVIYGVMHADAAVADILSNFGPPGKTY
jgi:hypothetical protein